MNLILYNHVQYVDLYFCIHISFHFSFRFFLCWVILASVKWINAASIVVYAIKHINTFEQWTESVDLACGLTKFNIFDENNLFVTAD